MHRIISNLLTILYDETKSLNNLIINILYYICFFKDKQNVTSYRENMNLYNTNFYTKYMYKIQMLSTDELQQIGELSEEISYDDDIDYLKLIAECLNLRKELKHLAKEIRSYSTNNLIVEYMIKLMGKDFQNKKITNLFSGTGTFLRKILGTTLYGYDINEELNIIANILIKLQSNIDFSQRIFKGDLIKEEINIEKSDFIISDLPSDIKNLTHASCCNRIKQLKIRGTKSEPLIVQLVTKLLLKNGKAILFIPDSFLFGDSNQHIQTRKYLIDTFCVEQIVASPEHKKSILVFSNKKPEKQIKFTNINKTYDLDLDIQKISEKSYSLYYQNYHIELNKGINIKKGSFKIRDIINIDTSLPKNKDHNDIVLMSCKYNTFKITKLSDFNKYTYIYTTKNPEIYSQEFLNYHLFEFLSDNINYLTKGKTKSINIDLIYDLSIHIPDIQIQKNSLEYINSNCSVLMMLQQQISELNTLKNNLISTIILGKETKPLSELCNISHNSKNINTIQIHRNSNLAGTVSLTINDDDSSTNIFYLDIIDNKINKDVLFYILKYNEKELITLSNLGNTIQLPKSKLENIQIPILSAEEENNILKCVIIDNKIKKTEKIYQDLLSESNMNFL